MTQHLDNDDENTGPSRPISLRGVISIVSALLVAVVAACTLSITSVTSLAALRDIGKSHSAALLATATEKSLGLFEPQIRNLEVLQDLSRRRDWLWPSDDAATHAHWDQTMRTLWFTTRFRDAGLILYFWDNTRISFSQWNNTHTLHSVVAPTPASAPGGLPNQTFLSSRDAIDVSGRSADHHLTTATGSGDSYRTVGTSWGSTMTTLTAGGRSPTISGYIVRSSTDSRGTLVEKYVSMAMPLFRRTDALSTPASANLYGVALTGLFPDDLSHFLADTRATPNTQAFALDSRGFLLGSSMPATFQAERVLSAGAQASRPGCAASDAAGAASTGPNTEVCRTSWRDYGYAPLAALPDSVLEPEAPSVMLFSTGGDNFFVAYVTVPLRLPGMTITLILLMPEADVIGDVVQSRNVAIGIVAALVVVAAVINFVVISVLLSPLEGVAARMRKAANLEDDAEEESVSAMAEVAALQEAYYEMNDELNRIRSFVPQSVLLAKKNAMETTTEGGLDAEEDDEGDLDLSGNDVADVGRRNTVNAAALSGLANSSGPSLGNSGGSRAGSRGNLLRASGEDVQSQISRRSSRSMAASSHRGASGGVLSKGAVALANLSLKPRVVTIVAANLCGFLSQVSNALNKDATVAHITDLVDFVYRTVSKHGGVVASYHGDHFVATFNAVKVCGAHALGAARAATLLTDGADGVGFGSALRVGVATGRCQVGNLGNKEVKAFSTVGPAYQHACVLERMGRLYGDADERSVLATRRTCADIATQFRFRFVDVVALPGRERGGAGATITPIATLLHPVIEGHGTDGNDDEWLYVVADAGEGDANAAWNEAFNKLMSDDVVAAKALVAEYKSSATAEMPIGAAAGSGAIQSMSSADLLKKERASEGGDPVPYQVSLTSPSPSQPSLLSSSAAAVAEPSSPARSPGVAALTNSTALGPSWGSGAASARRPVCASEQEITLFEQLCGMEAMTRFRDMGEFYNAAFSI